MSALYRGPQPRVQQSSVQEVIQTQRGRRLGRSVFGSPPGSPIRRNRPALQFDRGQAASAPYPLPVRDLTVRGGAEIGNAPPGEINIKDVDSGLVVNTELTELDTVRRTSVSDAKHQLNEKLQFSKELFGFRLNDNPVSSSDVIFKKNGGVLPTSERELLDSNLQTESEAVNEPVKTSTSVENMICLYESLIRSEHVGKLTVSGDNKRSVPVAGKSKSEKNLKRLPSSNKKLNTNDEVTPPHTSKQPVHMPKPVNDTTIRCLVRGAAISGSRGSCPFSTTKPLRPPHFSAICHIFCPRRFDRYFATWWTNLSFSSVD
jgi:hypothetical protein